MDHYLIWCNLKDSHKDLEFARAVTAYLGHLRERGHIKDFGLARRKLGLGPSDIGEFQIRIGVQDLAQLDAAFQLVARRNGDIERLHAAVYSKVTDVKIALYRDFPDPQRGQDAASADSASVV